MIVVDTNVIAYFVLREQMAVASEAVFRRDPDWNVPRLWRSEMRNVLWLGLRRGTIDLHEALRALSDAEFVISGREHEVDSARVLELGAQSGCTAYDCEFVALAEHLGVPLVTGDKKLLAAFASIAVSMAEFASF